MHVSSPEHHLSCVVSVRVGPLLSPTQYYNHSTRQAKMACRRELGIDISYHGAGHALIVVLGYEYHTARYVRSTVFPDLLMHD